MPLLFFCPAYPGGSLRQHATRFAVRKQWAMSTGESLPSPEGNQLQEAAGRVHSSVSRLPPAAKAAIILWSCGTTQVVPFERPPFSFFRNC